MRQGRSCRAFGLNPAGFQALPHAVLDPSAALGQNRAAMAYADLRDFVARLESEGRLVRVSAPVSTRLEMTEIQTRLLAEEGPAVLFENVVDANGMKASMPTSDVSKDSKRSPLAGRVSRGPMRCRRAARSG